MTELATIDTTNYAAMAKAMGMGQSATEKKTSALARLRINHTPVMGQAEVKGKQVNVEVVEGGTYKLEIPDGLHTMQKRFQLGRLCSVSCTRNSSWVMTVRLTVMSRLLWEITLMQT